MHNAYESVLTS